LYKYWLGHAGRDMSDLYDKIKEDVTFRMKWAQRCGFLFELPSVVPSLFRRRLRDAEGYFPSPTWGDPFLNCFLFSPYHFWQPYNLPTIFFLCLPMVSAAWKAEDFRVSLSVHMVLNLIGAIGSLLAVLRMH
jgi:hypothetical protein